MSRRGIPGTLGSTRTFAIVVAVVLAAVLAGVAGAAAGVGADPVDGDGPAVDPPTYDPEPPTGEGVATLISDGERSEYDDFAAAVDAAEPGDTVEVTGVFEPDGPVVVDTPNVTVRAGDAENAGGDAERRSALVDGGGEGTVLVVAAPNVTVDGLWLANGGSNLETEDAGVHVTGDAHGVTLSELYLTDVSFGVWVDGADDVTVRDSRIEGADAPRFADRGNGIHLWQVTGAEIRGNDITETRDGIYYSWAEEVVAEGNTMWNLRFGVHYMYSNDNRLADNVAFENDVGYALMVSDRIEVVNNTAVANRGSSGHGILLKEIDDTTVRDNTLVANDRGVFLYNAQDNELVDNLIYANGVGVHHSAGTENTRVAGNSFVENDEQVLTTTRELVAWNGTDRGNYWSDAAAVDGGDGVSETRHRPAGAAERLVQTHPAAAVFADSPAFDAIRMVESRFPVVETAGIVDHRPLTASAHDVEPYRPYAAAVNTRAEYDDDPGDDHHHGHDGDDHDGDDHDGHDGDDHNGDDHDDHDDYDDHDSDDHDDYDDHDGDNHDSDDHDGHDVYDDHDGDNHDSDDHDGHDGDGEDSEDTDDDSDQDDHTH